MKLFLKLVISFGIMISSWVLDFSPARAFDIEPEYHGLSETERTRIESPSDIDGEYQSIVNSYLLPEAWDQKFAASNRIFQTSTGSLTNQHFLIYSRAKLKTQLSDAVDFQFTYINQQDREINQTRHVVELRYRLSSWLQLGSYAEMAHFKRDNDIGFAAIVGPREFWTTRFYVTFFDFTRGNHNDQPDRFLGADPLTIGATSDFNSSVGNDAIVARAGFRFDRSVNWNLPQENAIFGYEKRLAFASVNFKNFSLRGQWDSTFKCRTSISVPGTVDGRRADRTQLMATSRHGLETDAVSYELNLMYAAREWTNQNASHVFHQNILPGGTVRIRAFERADGHDAVLLSGDATDFRTFGDLAMTPANQKHQSTEARLQAAYEMRFRNDARLIAAFNFDLDEWSTVPTFDGGNIRFHSEF